MPRACLAGLCLIAALAGCGGDDRPQTPAELQQGIVVSRDDARSAREKKDAKAAAKAADRADKLLAELRKSAQEGPAVQEAGACLPDAEKAAVEARYWAELADEERRLAEKVGGLKARAYRAGRGAALAGLFKGLSLAAEQAGKQGLEKLPEPAQAAAGSAAELAAELTGRAPLADGSPDWAGISTDMDALSKELPPTVRMMTAAGMAVGARDDFALYEIEAVDAAALASPEQRVYRRALRGWIYSLQGWRHLATREFEALAAEAGDGADVPGAGRCREILAGVHLYMAFEHCSGREFEKADLELARAIKVMPDPWFAGMQNAMARVVESERQAADDAGGARNLGQLAASADGQWYAERLSRRAEEVRNEKDKAGPFFDPAFKRELVIHLVAKAARDCPAAKKLQGWLGASGSLGRRFLEVLPGGGGRGEESRPQDEAP